MDTPTQPVPAGPVKKPLWQKKRFIIPAAIVTFLIIIGACSGGGSKQAGTVDPAPTVTTAAAPSTAVAAPATTAPEPTTAAPAPPVDTTTAAQKNALRKAESYLAYQAFSRPGLIKQLEFEKFASKDATWAVDQLKVDWNKQAVEKAKSYLEYQGFSRDGLIKQLLFEGFTPAQAEYGVKGVGL